MVKQIKPALDGLCSTCTSAPACALRKDRAAAILECEEFSGNGSSARGRRKSSAPAQARRRAGAYPDAGVGLCVTCEARKVCTSSNPEGGVWHCEEYR
jgi:hypothetical protein